MGCLLTLLLLMGPRAVLFGIAIFTNWYAAFEFWWIGFICWILAPWSSLAWITIYLLNDGNLTGGYLILFIIGMVMDAAQIFASGDD